MTKYNILLQSRRQFFSTDDLGVIWNQKKRSDTLQSARNFVNEGKLFRIARGVYTLKSNWGEDDMPAVANKLISPSYVTGLTVLIREGLSFQYSNVVHSVALYYKRKRIDDVEFEYRKLKPILLYNSLGVNDENGVSIASIERAIADMIYLGLKSGYEVKYWDEVDWEKLAEIGKIYGKKSVMNKIEKLKEEYDTTA